jgi:hypothetical protein
MFECLTNNGVLAEELNKCNVIGLLTPINVIALNDGDAKLRVIKLNV